MSCNTISSLRAEATKKYYPMAIAKWGGLTGSALALLYLAADRYIPSIHPTARALYGMTTTALTAGAAYWGHNKARLDALENLHFELLERYCADDEAEAKVLAAKAFGAGRIRCGCGYPHGLLELPSVDDRAREAMKDWEETWDLLSPFERLAKRWDIKEADPAIALSNEEQDQLLEAVNWEWPGERPTFDAFQIALLRWLLDEVRADALEHFLTREPDDQEAAKRLLNRARISHIWALPGSDQVALSGVIEALRRGSPKVVLRLPTEREVELADALRLPPTSGVQEHEPLEEPLAFAFRRAQYNLYDAEGRWLIAQEIEKMCEESSIYPIHPQEIGQILASTQGDLAVDEAEIRELAHHITGKDARKIDVEGVTVETLVTAHTIRAHPSLRKEWFERTFGPRIAEHFDRAQQLLQD